MVVVVSFTEGSVAPEMVNWIARFDALQQQYVAAQEKSDESSLRKLLDSPPQPPNVRQKQPLDAVAAWLAWTQASPASPLPHCGIAACESFHGSHSVAADRFAACAALGHSSTSSPATGPYFSSLAKNTMRALELNTTVAARDYLRGQLERVSQLLQHTLPQHAPARPKLAGLTVGILCPFTPQLGGDQRRTAWGPNATQRGISGAEEAVIYLSRALVRRGIWVEVHTLTLS